MVYAKGFVSPVPTTNRERCLEHAAAEGRPALRAQRFAMFTDRYGTPWMLEVASNRARLRENAP